MWCVGFWCVLVGIVVVVLVGWLGWNVCCYCFNGWSWIFWYWWSFVLLGLVFWCGRLVCVSVRWRCWRWWFCFFVWCCYWWYGVGVIGFWVCWLWYWWWYCWSGVLVRLWRAGWDWSVCWLLMMNLALLVRYSLVMD